MSASRAALAREVAGHPVHWIAFGAGAGLLPIAPGTWGSALALMLIWVAPPLTAGVQLLAALAGFAVGVWVCGSSARRLGVHDHQGIVFDEMVGMLIVAAAVPRTLPWFGAAFLLFRLFDVWKPWPIRDVDHRLGGGLGIMLDDVLAAVYAAIVLAGLRSLIEPAWW